MRVRSPSLTSTVSLSGGWRSIVCSWESGPHLSARGDERLILSLGAVADGAGEFLPTPFLIVLCCTSLSYTLVDGDGGLSGHEASVTDILILIQYMHVLMTRYQVIDIHARRKTNVPVMWTFIAKGFNMNY